MLQSIRIKNFTIVNHLEIFFHEGMNVITGETGAGKSVVAESINLLVGKRAQTLFIKDGSDQATIEATFIRDTAETIWSEVFEILASADIEMDDELQLRRVIRVEGKNKSYLNSRIVPLTVFERIGELLFECTGQQQSQTILKTKNQLQLFDRYAGLQGRVEDFKGRFRRYNQWLDEFQALVLREKNIRDERIYDLEKNDDYLRLDLNSLNLDQLRNESISLRNAEKIIAVIGTAHERLYAGEGAIYSQIAEVVKYLGDIQSCAPHLGRFVLSLEHILEQISDDQRELSSYLASFESSEEQLHDLEEKLSAVAHYCRKYRVDEHELDRDSKETSLRLEEWRNLSQQISKMNDERDEYLSDLIGLAEQLHADRGSKTSSFEGKICKELTNLCLANAMFEVRLDRRDENGVPLLDHSGFSELTFLFSANPGSDPRPIDKIISGGELARLYLALKSVLGGSKEGGTILFDEIEAGTGGAVAEAIGTKLKNLSLGNQIIVITHSAQIARLADRHLLIRKEITAHTTQVSVQSLDSDQRQGELARMIGGKVITEKVRDLASEMLKGN